MEIGDRFTAEIIDFAYHEGKGVAKVDGFVVFIPWTIPGDVVDASLKDTKANFGFGELIKILRPSDRRTSPLCPLFTMCGGCTLQNLDYERQLSLKGDYVLESLKRIAHIEPSCSDLFPIIRSPEIWYYRNKMEFVFGERGGNLILGLHKRGSYKDYVDVKKCYIFSKSAPQIMDIVRDFATRTDLNAYNPITHVGFLRHLVMREAKSTGKMLVNLVTDQGDINWQDLVRDTPEYLSSLIWTLNTRKADAVIPEKQIVIKGIGDLVDKIGDIYFCINSNSFVQPNPSAAAIMYERILELLELRGEETVLDLYCGSGGIGLSLAKSAKKIFGIDSNQLSIEAASKNAQLNRIENITFITEDVRKALYRRKGWRDRIDVAVLDPPRDGVSKRTMKHLLYLRTPKILYVSCNPTTLARDASIIIESGYDLQAVQPIDMFPHTYHVEVLTLFKRK